MPFRKILKITIFIVVFIGGFVCYPNKALLYCGMPTHYNLTEQAVRLYNLAYDPDITTIQLESILKGSVDEDTPPRWLFHLYDPIYNRAPGSWFGVHTARDWAINSGIQQSSRTALASVIYKYLNGDFNYHGDYSWPASVNYAVNNNDNQAFYGLGHILHLIGDMSVPAHTRDDAHPPGNVDPYETWTASSVDYSADFNVNMAENLYKNKTLPKQIYDIGQAFDELALYSNSHFFSLDSLPNTDLSKDYYNPVILVEKTEKYGTSSSRIYAWGRDENRNYFKLAKVQYDLAKNEKIYQLEENDTNLQTDYWTHLAPKAVQYGAGVIKLFLEQIGKDTELTDAYKFSGQLPMIADVIPPMINQGETGEVKGISTENQESSEESQTQTEQINQINQINQPDDSNKPEEPENPDGSIVVSGQSTANNSWEAPKIPEQSSDSEDEEEPTPPEPGPEPNPEPEPEPDLSLNPLEIKDLKVVYSNNIFITLQWTAPARNEEASLSYDLRYFEDEITEENWGSAKPISDFAFSQQIPDVEASGSLQTIDITPLKFNKTYYFAIKTSDGTNSQISNVAEYLTDAPPGLMKSAWPVFQRDVQSTGFVPYNGPGQEATPSVELVADTEIAFSAAPVINSNGIIYIGDYLGTFYAIDSKTGELKWTPDSVQYEAMDGGIHNSAALAQDGTIYISAYGGTYLFAFTSTGKLKWRYRIAGPNDGGSSPVIGSDGVIYIAAREEGRVFAINPDGTKKWEYLISGSHVNSSPVLGSDGAVYVAWRMMGFDGYVTSLDSEGNLRWQSDDINPDPFAGLSIDANDNIYIGSSYFAGTGYLRSLNPADGKLNWSFPLGGRVNVPANIDDNGIIYITNEGGIIFILNSDGNMVGTLSTGINISEPLIIEENGIIYSVSGQIISAFSSGGTEKWSLDLGAQIDSSPIISDNGVLYIATGDGKIWKIGD